MKEKIGNTYLYYEISGIEEGPWLILLHGISGSTRCWKYQTESFNKHFHVLNLDLAGHGNSTSLGTEKYCGAIIANQIRILMDRLAIDKAHYLGLSLGTIIQQYFSQLFPERVLSMIYASPITKPNYLSRFFNTFADKVFLKIFSKNIYLKLMAKMMLPGKAHKKSRDFFLQETFSMENKEFLKWWKLIVQGDHYYYLSNSNIPALIVAGKKDFCFYKDAIKLKDKYSNCQFVEMKDAGHVFIFQKANKFNNIAINYIKSVEEAENDENIAS